MTKAGSFHFEHTIKSELIVNGVMAVSGHSSALRIKPAKAGSGITFIRLDYSNKLNKAQVKAQWQNVYDINPGYSIKNKYNIAVHRVDNILAALYSSGIDNAIIEIQGSEVPYIRNHPDNILTLIKKTGLSRQNRERQLLFIKKDTEIKVSNTYATLLPHSSSQISFNSNRYTDNVENNIFSLSNPQYEDAHHPSSHFLFHLESIEQRKLIAPYEITNFTDHGDLSGLFKTVHRLTDKSGKTGINSILATMALVGSPIIGHLYTSKPENEILHLLFSRLFDDPDNWSYMCFSEYQHLSSQRIKSTY